MISENGRASSSTGATIRTTHSVCNPYNEYIVRSSTYQAEEYQSYAVHSAECVGVTD